MCFIRSIYIKRKFEWLKDALSTETFLEKNPEVVCLVY